MMKQTMNNFMKQTFTSFIQETVSYVNFKGELDVKTYWGFMLWYHVWAVLAITLSAITGNVYVGLAMIIALWAPHLGCQIRRSRDVGLSPWFVLSNLVPYVGPIVVLLVHALPTGYMNKFKKQ